MSRPKPKSRLIIDPREADRDGGSFVYEVIEGDTLAGIAEDFTGDWRHYLELVEHPGNAKIAQRLRLGLISVGERLVIPAKWVLERKRKIIIDVPGELVK